MSSGNEVDCIYNDFSKAFDTVNHSVLIEKLHTLFGIHGCLLDWFASYLTDRTQRVVISGFVSSEIIPTSGVPQGSHLGPLLFIMFIDDIKHCIRNSEFELYADDLKICKIVNNNTDQIQLQEDIDRITEWCRQNKMSLNTNKCYHIKFSRKFNKYNSSYNINGVDLAKVDEVKDLGIAIDTHM
ncbi:unnamed protein product [Parnassius mnemosyne]|uniref:Reverse transcriptase domain-containing protein n=1 Tax=Parnassius mnemosyne TaxID=213953 RepID=A0AAV1KUH6_9NEOP